MKQIKYITINYEIIDKPFLYEYQLISRKTAIVTISENKKVTKTLNLAYIDTKLFNKTIEGKNKIGFTSCLFENLPPISGNFESIELSNSVILNTNININVNVRGNVNFQKTHIFADKIDFNNWEIEGNTNFAEITFVSDTLTINKSVFKQGLILKYATFSCNFVEMQEIKVETEEFNISNSHFGDTNVTFSNSYFGKCRKNFSYSSFGEGFIDFSHVNFGQGDVLFERTIFGDGNISFRSTDFGIGTVDFRRAEFGNGEKDFTNANFGDGNVKFINAIFNSGKINFRFANFGKGEIDFHFTKFGDTVFLFDHIYSDNGILDFRGAEFDKAKISIIDVTFGDGDIIFESFEQKEGQFTIKNSFFGRGIITFENAQCSNVDFQIENVDFGVGSIFFTNAEFRTIVFRHTHINSYFDLRIKQCEKIDFANAIVSGVVDLNPVGSSLNVNKIYFQGVRLLGRIYIDWHMSNICKIIGSQETSNHEKSEQFRILKENYHSIGQYEYEDLAYVEFKRTEAKAKLDNVKKEPFHKKIIAYFNYWFEWLILNKMGQYATNPVRVFFSMLVVYMIFSLIYIVIGYANPSNPLIASSLFKPGDPHVLSIVGRGFYHSIVTFLTIGYGDYYPVGFVRFLSGFEGFLGLFMMSYFTVAFVRKILR